MIHSRRSFLSSSATCAGFAGLQGLFARSGNATPAPSSISAGYGPLKRDPHRLLDLPAGFQYTVVSWQGDPMDDGLLVPGKPDGMAAFPGPAGSTLVVRNHELSAHEQDLGAFGTQLERLGRLPSTVFYDFGGGKQPGLGGTTTFLFDTRTGKVERQLLSLAGTERNCAGGQTPWGTWVTCEETMVRAGNGYEQDHGYCFEVPASFEGVPAAPVPLKALGRFNHEAIAVDPATSMVYLTEDRPDGLFYRFLPHQPGQLSAGGRLQALVVRDAHQCDTRNWEQQHWKPGEARPVHWLDMEEVEAPEDDLRERGFAAGAARFARGEGIWYGHESVYFACTNGGSAQKGQIWRYQPPVSASDGGMLSLFVEPNDGGILDHADNLTVAPWGDLVVCEDGGGEQFLVGIRPTGEIYKIARNATPGNSELAGCTFSPDGSTLFLNIQHMGLTLAITGAWQG